MASQGPLLAVDTDNGIEVWNLATEKRVQQWVYPECVDEANALTISPDGSQVVAAMPNLYRWNVETGAELPTFRIRQSDFPIHALQFSLDGSKLVVRERHSMIDYRLKKWAIGVRTRGYFGRGRDYDSAFFEGLNWYGLAASHMVGPRTRLLHTTAWTIAANAVVKAPAPMLTVLDAQSGATLAVFPNENGECAVSPDARMIAYTAKGFDYAWRTDIALLDRDWTDVGTVDLTGSLVFSPDSKHLLVDGYILWDIAGRKEVRDLAAAGQATARFSQDGKLLALVKADGPTRYDRYFDEGRKYFGLDITTRPSEHNYLQLVDVGTGKPKSYATGYGQGVGGVEYSPDGRWLASFSGETLFLHDAKTGAEMRRWIAHKRAIRGFAFSPDGKTLASTTYDGVIAVWDPSTGKERRRHAFGDTAASSFAFTRTARG